MGKYLQLLEVELSPELCAIAAAQDDCRFHSISEIYWHNCPKIHTDGIAKVRILFHAPTLPSPGIQQLIDVVIFPVALELQTVLAATGEAGRKIAADTIHAAFLNVCRHFQWDTAPARVAWRKITTAGYKAFERWKKPVWRKDRRQFAQAWWRYEDKITLGIDLQGETRGDIIFAVLPGLGGLWDALGSLRWQNNHIVQLWRKNRRDYWSYDLLSERVEFVYGPAQRGDPKGEYDLGRMYLDGFVVQQDPAAAHYWISLSAAHGLERAKKHLEQLNSIRSSSAPEGTQPSSQFE